MFDIERIRKRELNPRCKHDYLSIGFSVDSVTSLTRLKSKIQHRGCINTASWNKDGARLVTGSDDRTVKIWNTSKSFEDITIVQTIHTSHRGNIFCAESQPYHESNIVSCAADGVLLLNDINIPRNNSKHLMTTSLLMHMFHFDIVQPHVLYTAEECGFVSRVDLRISGSEKIFSNKRKGYVSPIKTLAQSFVLGANNLFLGGDGYFIDLHDLRLLSQVNKEYRSSYIMNDCHLHTSAVKVFTPYSKIITGNNQSQSYSYNWKNEGVKKKFITSEVSLSGMQIGKDGTTLLANFQGDQIYSFDILGSNSYSNSNRYNCDDDGITMQDEYLQSSSTSHHRNHHRHEQSFQPSTDSILYKTAYKHDTDKIVGAKACYGGHFNYATFLKSVSFFGPEDEYIVAGCDSGRLWIWDTKSGYFQGRNQHQKDEQENQSSSSSSSLIYDTEDDALNILPDNTTNTAAATNHELNVPLNSHTGRILNILKADQRTCNGVVAHPFAPLLISYGIDSDVKVFASAAYASASDNDGDTTSYSTTSDEYESSDVRSKIFSSVPSTSKLIRDTTTANAITNDSSTIKGIKPLKIVRKSTQIYILPNDAYIRNQSTVSTNNNNSNNNNSDTSLSTTPSMNSNTTTSSVLIPTRIKAITRFSSYSEMLDLPKILEDNKEKLHLSRRCAVFNPDQYAIHISALRQHSNTWRDVLPQEYYTVDEGSDCPSDVAVMMRVHGLNVRKMVEYILDVLRSSSLLSSSSAPNNNSSNTDTNRLVNEWLTALNQLKQPKQSSDKQYFDKDTFVNCNTAVDSVDYYGKDVFGDNMEVNGDSTKNGSNKVNHNNKREKVSRSCSSKNNYKETTSSTSLTVIGGDTYNKTTSSSSSSSTSTPISKRMKTEEIGNTAAEEEEEGQDDDDEEDSFGTSECGDTTMRAILDSSQRLFTSASASNSNATTDSNAKKDEKGDDISDIADDVDGSDNNATVIDDSMWKTLVLCEIFRLAAKAKQNGNCAMKNNKQQGGGNGEIAVYFYLKAKRYCDYISSNIEENSFEVFPFKSNNSNTIIKSEKNAINTGASSKNATTGGGTSSSSKRKSSSSIVHVYVQDELRVMYDNDDDSGVMAQSTAKKTKNTHDVNNNISNTSKSSSQTVAGTAGVNNDGSEDSVVDMNNSSENSDDSDDSHDDGEDEGSGSSSATDDNEHTESMNAYLLNSVWRWRFGGTNLHDDEDDNDADEEDDDHSYDDYSNEGEESSVEDSSEEEGSNDEENSNDDESGGNESVDDEEDIDEDDDQSSNAMSISIDMHSSFDSSHSSNIFDGDNSDESDDGCDTDSPAFIGPQPSSQPQQLQSSQEVLSYDSSHSNSNSSGDSNMMVTTMTVGDDSNMSAAVAADLNNRLTVTNTASSSSSNNPAISNSSENKKDNNTSSRVKFFNIVSPTLKSVAKKSLSSASQSLFQSVTQQQQSNIVNDKQPTTTGVSDIIAKHDDSSETEDKDSDSDNDKNKNKDNVQLRDVITADQSTSGHQNDDSSGNKNDEDNKNDKDTLTTSTFSPSTLSISPDTITTPAEPITTSIATPTITPKQQYSSVQDVLQSICTTAKTEILEKQRIQLVSTSLANLIAAYIMAEEYAEAKRTCDRLVVFNKMWHTPLDAKFYYRRGSIYYHLHDHHKAQEDLIQSNLLAVSQTGKKDALVNQLLKDVKSALDKEGEQEKKLYAGTMLKAKKQLKTGDNYDI